jgi:2-polyprenyl-3-methyl-5-hydroxy-6-metoxy-1,4-benzoquinol methylase
MKNKGWNWDLVNEPVWKKPCEESFYLAYRWQGKGYKDILDIGCGLGRHSLQFAMFGFNVTSIDIAEQAVKETEKTMKENNFACNVKIGNFCELQFENQTFDSVFSFLTISHSDTAGVHKAINEIHRVLREGGEMFITLNSQESDSFKNKRYPMIDEYTFIKTNKGPEEGEPHFYADIRIVEELVKDFKIVWLRHAQDLYHNEEKYGGWNYFVLARK